MFGTPVTREQFDHAVERRTDYITGVLRADDPAKVWSEHFERIVAVAQRLIRTARDLGVTAYPGARMEDLTDATARHDCVILLAHWRGAFFSVEDLAGNAAHVIARFENGSPPVLSCLRPVPKTAVALVDALNLAVSQRRLLHLLPPPVARAGMDSQIIGEVLCRDLLDDVLFDLVPPGNRLELFDGLHTLGEIEAALCDKFRGELVLVSCHSEAVTAYLRLRRSNQIRYLYWPVSIHPIPQYLLIEETLKRAAATGNSFILTRLAVEQEL